jgi:hypothetical protein
LKKLFSILLLRERMAIVLREFEDGNLFSRSLGVEKNYLTEICRKYLIEAIDIYKRGNGDAAGLNSFTIKRQG